MHKTAVCVDKCPTGNLNDTITCIPTKFIPNCPSNETMYPTLQRLGTCYPKEQTNLHKLIHNDESTQVKILLLI